MEEFANFALGLPLVGSHLPTPFRCVLFRPAPKIGADSTSLSGGMDSHVCGWDRRPVRWSYPCKLHQGIHLSSFHCFQLRHHGI